MNKNDLAALVAVGVFGAVNVWGWTLNDDFTRACIKLVEGVKGRQAAIEYSRTFLNSTDNFIYRITAYQEREACQEYLASNQ